MYCNQFNNYYPYDKFLQIFGYKLKYYVLVTYLLLFVTLLANIIYIDVL